MDYTIHYSTNETDPNSIKRDMEDYVRNNPEYKHVLGHVVRRYKSIPENIGTKRTMSIPTACFICQKNGNDMFVMYCGHIFHEKCLLNWFTYGDEQNSLHCPICTRT